VGSPRTGVRDSWGGWPSLSVELGDRVVDLPARTAEERESSHRQLHGELVSAPLAVRERVVSDSRQSGSGSDRIRVDRWSRTKSASSRRFPARPSARTPSITWPFPVGRTTCSSPSSCRAGPSSRNSSDARSTSSRIPTGQWMTGRWLPPDPHTSGRSPVGSNRFPIRSTRRLFRESKPRIGMQRPSRAESSARSPRRMTSRPPGAPRGR
jgi:hypothetical protein